MTRKPIKAGDVVRILPEWQDAGDETVRFMAIEDEDGGRVKIQADCGLALNPVQVVETRMIECVK